MLGATKVICVIWCLLSLGVPLFAQTLPIPPSELPNLQPKENNPAKENLPAPKGNNADSTRLEKKQQPAIKAELEIFEALYDKPEVNEKKMLRKEWQDAFGIDVWYPYYKTKEFEDWISDRLSIKVFKIKGRAKLEDNQFKYTFIIKF